jgi:DNA-binding IclR family transcriptional regulator
VLDTLLCIVASRGTESSTELARRLGVSHVLLENMLEELTREGYLKAVVGEGSLPCEYCPLHRACLFEQQARIWALSERGENLLAKRGHKGAT